MTVAESLEGQPCDLMIALHAKRSATSIKRFGRRHPDKPMVVVMTGTDLHVDMKRSNVVAESLSYADRIVLLEPEAAKLLPLNFRKRVDVIYQSASRVVNPPKKLTRWFEITLVGHLRPVKDPFRTAEAANLLPMTSRIRVVHFGKALSAQMEKRAKRETEVNSRYQWLGRVPHGKAQRRLARSRLTVLSSLVEGAPSAISEAVVNDVPILATRIDASIGLLGADHPGLFEVGDTEGLAQLMFRAETDKKFYSILLAAGKKLKPKFSIEKEIKSWRDEIAMFF